MANQVRSCTNSTGLDTIKCDAYCKSLVPAEQKMKINGQPRCPRDRTRSNNMRTAYSVPSNATRARSRQANPRQQNLTLPKNQSNLITSYSHKELVNDNSALVEVTVRAHTGRKPHTNDNLKNNRNEPWSELLKTNATGNLSSFGSYDPLRTVHFLAKELQSKLKMSNQKDTQVIDMITNMQEALDRVPPEIGSIHIQQQLENLPSRKSPEVQAYYRDKVLLDNADPPEKLTHVKHSTADKSCQTNGTTISQSHLFKKQLEASTNKLESSCKQMEKLCNQLRSEKERTEHLLHAERDTVAFLRKQIGQLETERIESTNLAYQQLNQERNFLQVQVKKLQAQIDSYQGPEAHQLKSLAQQLQMEKTKAEEDNMSLRHKLTLTSMEKEKYITILSVRDRQINEIKSEMNQLQDVVNEQLLELQKSPFMSTPSSQSTVGVNYNGMSWPVTQLNNNKEGGDTGLPTAIPSSPLPSNLSFRELPSGDSSATNFDSGSSKTKINDEETISHLSKQLSGFQLPSESSLEKLIMSRCTGPEDNIQSNIRGMFTELKRQAFLVNVPLPAPPTNEHMKEHDRSNNS